METKENNWKDEDGLRTLSAMAGVTPELLSRQYPNRIGLSTVLKALNISETLIYGTPGGGLHLLYRGVLPNSARSIGPGIDTRGTGGYIVIPPSVWNGRNYEVLYSTAIAVLPAFFKEKMKAGKEKKKTVEGFKVPAGDIQTGNASDIQDSAEAVLSVIEMLKTAEHAEEGSGRRLAYRSLPRNRLGDNPVGCGGQKAEA